MANFFKSLFSSQETLSPEEKQAKAALKQFEIFKYDGMRALRVRQIPFAIQCFTQALDIQDDTEVMGLLINTYASMNETEKALEVARQLTELTPDDMQALFIRATLLHQDEQEEAALADCLHILASDTENPALFLLLGQIKNVLGERQTALEYLERALTLKDNFTAAYLLQAELLLEEGQPELAMTNIEKLIELAPEEELVYLLQGLIYERLGQTEQALASYELVMELDPFNEEAEKRKSRLLGVTETPEADGSTLN